MKLTILTNFKIQFISIKCIHIVSQPSLLPIFRTLFKTLKSESFPLNNIFNLAVEHPQSKNRRCFDACLSEHHVDTPKSFTYFWIRDIQPFCPSFPLLLPFLLSSFFFNSNTFPYHSLLYIFYSICISNFRGYYI